MPAHDKYDPQVFVRAMPGSLGLLTHLAKRVGCDWKTARKYIDEYPVVMQAWLAERESILDLAESKMKQAIADGDGKMVRFALSKIGRTRGYGERTDVTLSGTLDTTHKLDLETLDKDTLAALIAAIGEGEDTQE